MVCTLHEVAHQLRIRDPSEPGHRWLGREFEALDTNADLFFTNDAGDFS